MFRKQMCVLSALTFVLVVAGMLSMVEAANPATFQVSFNCNRVVSVSVSTDNVSGATYAVAYNFGLQNTNAQVIASTPIFVHNTSASGTASIQNSVRCAGDNTPARSIKIK